MAEVAAGALVAEQIVATGVEVGAAVAVAAPTQPLKVSLKQLARATSEDTTYALTLLLLITSPLAAQGSNC